MSDKDNGLRPRDYKPKIINTCIFTLNDENWGQAIDLRNLVWFSVEGPSKFDYQIIYKYRGVGDQYAMIGLTHEMIQDFYDAWARYCFANKIATPESCEYEFKKREGLKCQHANPAEKK